MAADHNREKFRSCRPSSAVVGKFLTGKSLALTVTETAHVREQILLSACPRAPAVCHGYQNDGQTLLGVHTRSADKGLPYLLWLSHVPGTHTPEIVMRRCIVRGD